MKRSSSWPRDEKIRVQERTKLRELCNGRHERTCDHSWAFGLVGIAWPPAFLITTMRNPSAIAVVATLTKSSYRGMCWRMCVQVIRSSVCIWTPKFLPALWPCAHGSPLISGERFCVYKIHFVSILEIGLSLWVQQAMRGGLPFLKCHAQHQRWHHWILLIEAELSQHYRIQEWMTREHNWDEHTMLFEISSCCNYRDRLLIFVYSLEKI